MIFTCTHFQMTPKLQLLISILALLLSSANSRRVSFLSFQGKCVNIKGESSDQALYNLFKYDSDMRYFGRDRLSPAECFNACLEVASEVDKWGVRRTTACGWNKRARRCSLFREPVYIGDGTAGDFCWIWV